MDETNTLSHRDAVLSVLAKMNERPENTVRSLREFHESSRVLSSSHPRLIDEYPDQWVAVSGEGVISHGESLDYVLGEVDKKGLRRSDTLIRFIERAQRTLIL